MKKYITVIFTVVTTIITSSICFYTIYNLNSVREIESLLLERCILIINEQNYYYNTYHDLSGHRKYEILISDQLYKMVVDDKYNFFFYCFDNQLVYIGHKAPNGILEKNSYKVYATGYVTIEKTFKPDYACNDKYKQLLDQDVYPDYEKMALSLQENTAISYSIYFLDKYYWDWSADDQNRIMILNEETAFITRLQPSINGWQPISPGYGIINIKNNERLIERIKDNAVYSKHILGSYTTSKKEHK